MSQQLELGNPATTPPASKHRKAFWAISIFAVLVFVGCVGAVTYLRVNNREYGEDNDFSNVPLMQHTEAPSMFATVATLNKNVNLRDNHCGNLVRTAPRGQVFSVVGGGVYDCCFGGCYTWIPLSDNGRTVWAANNFLSISESSGANWSEYVPIPSNINQGITSISENYNWLMKNVGSPGCPISASCFTCGCSVSNRKIQSQITTMSVGPFKAAGYAPFLQALTRVFDKVKRDNPSLYNVVGTAGALCCRPVKKPDGTPSKNYSNHSWGIAIDLTISGALDARGDGKAQRGLLELAKYMNAERIYWAGGFTGEYEDAMHFEASLQLMDEWI